VTNVENSKNPYFDATETSQGDSGDSGGVIHAALPGTGTGSTAAGAGATVTGNNGTAVGSNALAVSDNSVAIGSGAQATGANAVALGQGSFADRDNSVSVGTTGGERQVTNVAAGTATTDAVNVGQLNDSIAAAVGPLPAGTTAKDYTDQRIAGVQSQINDVAKGAYSGVAAATALTMIPDVDKGKTLSFGVGASTYKGYKAVALGGTARITENIKVKAGAGMGSSGTTVGIGAAYQW